MLSPWLKTAKKQALGRAVTRKKELTFLGLFKLLSSRLGEEGVLDPHREISSLFWPRLLFSLPRHGKPASRQ